MAGPFTLDRSMRDTTPISLVPLIDVLLILLVFFMVTSTYLDLDMIPATEVSDGVTELSTRSSGTTLLIRVGADGIPVIRGEPVPMEALAGRLATAAAQTPQPQVLILPSATALTQDLVSVLDTAAEAGISQVRVVRLEATE